MCRSSLEKRLIVWIERKMMARLLLEIMLHHVTDLIAGSEREVSPQKLGVSKNRFHLCCKWTFASMNQLPEVFNLGATRMSRDNMLILGLIEQFRYGQQV